MFTICDFSYARLKSSNKFGFNSLNWKILHFGRNDTRNAPTMGCLDFAQHDKDAFDWYEMLLLGSAWHRRVRLLWDASTTLSMTKTRWLVWDASTALSMTKTLLLLYNPYYIIIAVLIKLKYCACWMWHGTWMFTCFASSNVYLRSFDNPCLSQPTRRKLRLRYV